MAERQRGGRRPFEMHVGVRPPAEWTALEEQMRSSGRQPSVDVGEIGVGLVGGHSDSALLWRTPSSTTVGCGHHEVGRLSAGHAFEGFGEVGVGPDGGRSRFHDVFGRPGVIGVDAFGAQASLDDSVVVDDHAHPVSRSLRVGRRCRRSFPAGSGRHGSVHCAPAAGGDRIDADAGVSPVRDPDCTQR